MKNLENVIFEVSGGIATIQMNRPEKYNSMIRTMALSIQYALDECAHDQAVRVVIIKGSGKAFCAGQDLNEVTGEQTFSISKIVSEHFNPIIKRMRDLEKPVIAAVNGVAAGAGANIAIAADLTVAKESTVFIQAFSKIGLIPDSGGTYFLPRLVGRQKATALMMLGDKLSAKEAVDIGMIYKAIPDEQFDTYIQDLATRLKELPPIAIRLTKRALNRSANNTLLLQLALEDQLQSQASQTRDYKEGIQAFLEKRKARFEGK